MIVFNHMKLNTLYGKHARTVEPHAEIAPSMVKQQTCRVAFERIVCPQINYVRSIYIWSLAWQYSQASSMCICVQYMYVCVYNVSIYV